MGEIASESINTEVILHEVSAELNFKLSLSWLGVGFMVSDISFLIERITLFSAEGV